MNLPTLKAELAQVDWTALVSALDIESKVKFYNSIMTDVQNRYEPFKRMTFSDSTIASGDVELRLLIERMELSYFFVEIVEGGMETGGSSVVSVIW
jgi:hypothetical protein